jgi:hypothetical protein
MVLRTILNLWLLVREWNKGDNSNLVSAVAYLDAGKYSAWICGYLTCPPKLESKLGSSAQEGPHWAGVASQLKT